MLRFCWFCIQLLTSAFSCTILTNNNKKKVNIKNNKICILKFFFQNFIVKFRNVNINLSYDTIKNSFITFYIKFSKKLLFLFLVVGFLSPHKVKDFNNNKKKEFIKLSLIISGATFESYIRGLGFGKIVCLP